jgi:hypothetical protein
MKLTQYIDQTQTSMLVQATVQQDPRNCSQHGILHGYQAEGCKEDIIKAEVKIMGENLF